MKKIAYLYLALVILTSCTQTLKTEKPQIFNFSTASRSAEPGTFSFDIPIVVKLDTVKSQLMEQLGNSEVAGIKIKLNEVKVYGANSSDLVIGLNVDAEKGWFIKIKGWIYLRGTPSLDVEKQTFGIKDVRIDAATEQALLNGAAWVLNPILKAVANGIKIDIRKVVDVQKEKLKNLAIDGYGTLNLDIKEFIIREIDITDTELEVRVKTSGYVAVNVDLK